jgi:HSP20 family protein
MLPAIRNKNSVLAQMAGTPANRLSAIFDRFFHEDPFFGSLMTPPAWSAPLSMWEDEHSVYVEVDAPGVTEKDIDVSVQDGSLIIRGERKSEEKKGGYDTRTYGQFEQRLTLPTPVDADKVEAKLANGVLSLTCPKSEAAKPRKIAVKSE